ncbi:MAG: HAD-IA family hydrolase [Defluviicoccus sp.]|nr:HAD-IA family hydrolase [Defluviicoccus sp.]
MIDAVLFDLDGTFADTAPDLGAALNRLRRELGHAPLPLHVLRPYTSHGVRGLLGAGLNVKPDDDGYLELSQRFLAYYRDAICVHTRVFDGMAELVQGLEQRGTKWGIVTNKSQRFTLPLVAQLGYDRRAACIVSGDSAPRPKPHPQPLLLASRITQCAPEHCLYVGDDVRDVVAGRAAGMTTVAVTYGYLGVGQPVESWGADSVVDHPSEILHLVGEATC